MMMAKREGLGSGAKREGALVSMAGAQGRMVMFDTITYHTIDDVSTMRVRFLM